nr:hypothetical protein [Flavobacterium sp.]
MKTIFLLFCSLLFSVADLNATSTEDNPNQIIQQMLDEMRIVNRSYMMQIDFHQQRISDIRQLLAQSALMETKIELLIEKDRIENRIYELQYQNNSDLSKIRYINGLQIIKILYEKVLSLDHHFASVR